MVPYWKCSFLAAGKSLSGEGTVCFRGVYRECTACKHSPEPEAQKPELQFLLLQMQVC